MNAPSSPTFVIMMLLCNGLLRQFILRYPYIYITNLVSVLSDLNCKNKKFKVEIDFVTAHLTRRRIPSKQELSCVI